MFKVNVSPDMNMYSLLISQGYDPTYALCEFLDNSIHAFQEYSDLDVLEIDIDFFSSSYHIKSKRNSIVITDRGPGIKKEVLKKALQPANKPSKSGLSEFGIGMKSAAVWFSNEWVLTTYPKGEGIRLSADFNLEKLLSEGRSVLEVTEKSSDSSNHGTIIELKGLRNRINEDKYEAICRGIGDIYQKFISRDENTVNINSSFDGKKTTIKRKYKGFETLKAPAFVKRKNQIFTTGDEKEWTVDVNTEFQGKPVKGFIHLMNSGGYKKNPGLVLFRHNRVIVGTTEKHYKPDGLYGTSNKAAGMRLQGELHLDEHPVSYTKDRFSFDDEDFGEHLAKDVSGLKDLLNQAENYRAKGAPSLEKVGVGIPDQKENHEKNSETDQPEPSEESTDSSTQEDDKSQGGNDENQYSTKPENEDDGFAIDKSETKIPFSEKIESALKKSKAKKPYRLYRSLCVISLVNHPILMYVGAWSFFEILARKCGNSGDDFTAFFSQQAQRWGFSKEDKKTFNVRLKHVSENGNIVKHHHDSMQVSAIQLANDFEVLEPLIVAALEHIGKSD
jgi:histidine kinase/DNA gyrase B/HSP90-like ATPase